MVRVAGERSRHEVRCALTRASRAVPPEPAMGQGASYHHHQHQVHQQQVSHWAMDSSDLTHSPHQVRQRVQYQQQQREMRELQLDREHQERHQQPQEVASLTGGCCGSGSSCSCGGGLSSTAAIYGTASAPDPTSHTVVVTPPRSLPHHHHHYHQQRPDSPITTSATATSSGRCSGTSGTCSNSSGCGHWCSSCRVRVQLEVECVGGMEARPSPSRGGRLRTLAFPKRHRHKTKTPTRDIPPQPKKKKTPWTFRLNCRLRPSKSEPEPETTSTVGCGACMCPSLRRPEPDLHAHHHHHHSLHGHPTSQDVPTVSSVGVSMAASPGGAVALRAPVIDLSRFNPEAYPIEDWEEHARQERAREMAEGVEPPPGFASGSLSLPQTHHSFTPAHHALTHLQLQHQHQLQLQQAGAAVTSLPLAYNSMLDLQLLLERSLRLGLAGPRSVATSLTEETFLQQVGRLAGDGSLLQRTVHTQVDYIHCLVPDLLSITNCVFYWGKMDRYEAERLLDNRPEGTFLLRDSAQEEYLFSVSFRRYGRSLHARIEQWNHKFSFDSHDPGVFASDTVCGLIEHYKDPSCCMFFEPMLTNPLARTFPFPLQHLCRAVICSTTTYDGINNLRLPKPLNNYLKEYHYKQRVRVRRLDH